MKASSRVIIVAAAVAILTQGAARADVILAVEHHHLQLGANTLLQAFGYNPDLDVILGFSSSSNQTIQGGPITDDSTAPWAVASEIHLTTDDILLWGKNGSSFNQGGDPNVWGFAYNPATQKYYATIYRPLRDFSGSFNLDDQRIVGVYDPTLPDGEGATVSNADGLYLLIDPSATFVTDGVQVGHRPTLALGAGLIPGTYTVTDVINETTLRLDRNAGSSVGDVRYYLSLQPLVTLKTFRQLFPIEYGATQNWPNNASAPGLSVDGSTLYIRDSSTGTVLAVSTTVAEQVSVFVSKQTFMDYVTAQAEAGRTVPHTGAEFSVANARTMDEIRVAENGYVYICEDSTDDIVRTLDGTVLETVASSQEIYEFYVSIGRSPTSGVNPVGIYVDKMGTVYWSENSGPRTIFKVPACGGKEHMRVVATNQEIMETLGGSSGLLNFQQRGSQILFNEYVSDNIGAVDMNTFEYGDFDGDFDADADDYATLFADCLAGPDVLVPPVGCTEDDFAKADLDDDGDVDLQDYRRFQLYATGPL